MKIGFDLDGVILDHSEMKMKLAGQWGFKISKRQTPSDLIKTVLPTPVLKVVQFGIYADPKTALLASLVNGVNELLEKLSAKGIPFYLVSRRRGESIQRGEEALKIHKLWPKYFNEQNVFFVGEPEEKNVKAVELGLTHFVDDEIKVLDCLTSVPNRFLLDLIDVFPDSNYYKRVKDWEQLSSLLE